MVVPEKYERFDELVTAVRTRVGGAFRELTLGARESLKNRLQSLLDTPPGGGAAGGPGNA